MSSRLIPPRDLPVTLWQPDHDNGPYPTGGHRPQGLLRLPPSVAARYIDLLRSRNLLAGARDTSQREDNGPIGGESLADTHEHFAKRFSGSCGRLQLYWLDPRNAFPNVSDSIVHLCSGGEVRLLDAPCGAGAGSVTLLSLIAELRDQEVLPAHPLKVSVLGADISEHARDIAEAWHDELTEWWLSNGIEVEWKGTEWDATDHADTGVLIERWRKPVTAQTKMALAVSSFSGFLGTLTGASPQRRWFDECAGSIQQLMAATARFGANTYWLEPPGNRHAGRVFPRLNNEVLAKSKLLRGMQPTQHSSEATLSDPVVSGGSFTVRSCGIHLVPSAA